MSQKAKLSDDMKAAMRAKDSQRVGAIRLVLAALKQKEVDERIELSDADVLSIIEKMIKQRRDSISQYQAANRQDLVDAESFELELLVSYMPAQLDEAAIAGEISKAIAETGAAGMADMGKVMGVLKGRLAGRADMGRLSSQVKAKLSGG